MNLFSNLEARIQSVFENLFSNAFPFQKPDEKFTLQVIHEVSTLYHSQGAQNPFAPDYFVIIAHPEITAKLESTPGLVDELTTSIELEGKEIGLVFKSKPTVSICSDDSMKLREIKVIGTYREDGLLETKGMALAQPGKNNGTYSEINAYLVLPDSRIIPLTQLAVNIGRKADNDIVIEDPRISRMHAQIRQFQDNYLIIDLNSTGGTYVNGKKVVKKVLQPGDVISLAGVSMIFNMDFSGSSKEDRDTQTKPVEAFENPSPEKKQRK